MVKKEGELKGSLDLKIDENHLDINKAVNCEIKSGHVSFHDTYLRYSSDANFSEILEKQLCSDICLQQVYSIERFQIE